MSDRTRIARKRVIEKPLATAPSDTLQRSAAAPEQSVDEVPPVVQEVLSTSGQPLDAAAQAFMEPRFGHDFSKVRVHTDERAVESAQAVNARAYTVGQDVVFGAGQYAPETGEGRGVLAHELTHVVQQGASAGERPWQVGLPSSPQEQEAERAAHAVALPMGESNVQVAQNAAPAQLQRLPAGDDDPIHQPIIDQYRKERGLPPGGVDESGQQVGPSDAEIKYGGLLQQAEVTAPPPANQQLSSDQAQSLSQQPLPSNVTANGGQTQTPQQPDTTPLVTRIPNEKTQFGFDTSIDSSHSFQVSFVARHWDFRRYAVKGVPVDIFHEPTMTLGVSLDNANFGTLMAQLSATALNVHIQQNGQDLIELGLGQLGLGFDSTGTKIISLGAQAEIHSADPHLSFTINGGGALKFQNGAVSTEWSSLTFGILVHWANP